MFKELRKNGLVFNIVVNLIFILATITILVPLFLCVSVSLSDSKALFEFGYTIFPKRVSFEAYQYVAKNMSTILQAYKISFFVTVVGTAIALLVTSMYAYVVSRRDFKGRVFFNYFAFVPMLFNGGLVSTYLWYVSIGLFNNIWVLILPTAFNAWYCIVLRSFFSTGVPVSLIESAKLDGAGEIRIFCKIVLPISVPGMATIALISALGKWNDWYTPLIYIRNEDLYGIQFYLKNIMTNLQMALSDSSISTNESMPVESARMAMCLIAIGPMIFIYPFVQRYFVKGLTIGAVKG